MPKRKPKSRIHSRKVKFDAFTVTSTTKSGRTKNTVFARQDGIHSQSWALAIVPQKQIGFLVLPLELREQIYRYSFTREDDTLVIIPEKKGRGFGTQYWGPGMFEDCKLATSHYTSLIRVSRQTYVDMVFLFYKESMFRFASVYAINLYLKVINPMKVSLLTTLDLTIAVVGVSNLLSKPLMHTLSSLESLRYFTLNLRLETTALQLVQFCLHCGRNHDRRKPKILIEVIGGWKSAQWDFFSKFEHLRHLEITIRKRFQYDFEIKDSPEIESFAAEVIERCGTTASVRLYSG